MLTQIGRFGKHFRRQSPPLPPRVSYAEGVKADTVCSKAKASAQEGFPHGNQIYGVEQNEPLPLLAPFPSDARHAYLPNPKLCLCFYRLFALTPCEMP